MIVMISSPLEPELAARVASESVVSELLYDPALLPPPRYPNDHGGDPAFKRDEAAQNRWDAMLARAEVLFGYPNESSAELARALAAGPNVRFVQGTSAGMGAHVKRAALPPDVLERVRFATAAGVHAGMLAGFAFYGLLSLRKDAARLAAVRAARRWEHFVMGELAGSTFGIIGVGQIGRAIARRARAFEMRVVAFNRDGAADADADESFATSALREQAPRLDALAVTLPITASTTHLVDAGVIAALQTDAVLINVGRGQVVDAAALTAALQNGALAGAVLDVFDPEPLPPDSPLWDLPNVVMSPHTAALSVHENARIVDLFCDNLRRFAAGRPLRNAVNLHEFY